MAGEYTAQINLLTERVMQLEAEQTTLSRRIQTSGGASQEAGSPISGFKLNSGFTDATLPDSTAFVGLAGSLLAGPGVTFTRIDRTPFLEISASGGGNMNADYVVDSGGNGTHLALYGTGGALLAAIATGVDKFIWVCTTHTETVTASTSINGMAANQQIKVMSGGPYHPSITINFNGAVLSQSAVLGANVALEFEGLEHIAATSKTVDFYAPTAGVQSVSLSLSKMRFSSPGTWQYVYNNASAAASTMGGLVLDRVFGTFTAIGNINSAGAAVAPFILRHSNLTLTNIVARTFSTDYELGSYYIIEDNELTVNGYGISMTYTFSSPPVRLIFNNNMITHTTATEFIRFGTTASSGAHDAVVVGNNYRGTTAGCNFFVSNPSAGSNITNIVVMGNSLSGPGSGNAVVFTTSSGGTVTTSVIQNATNGWDAASSGATTGTGGDHHTLSNLTTNDDHTQYAILAGRGTPVGNPFAGFASWGTGTGTYSADVLALTPGAYWHMDEASGNITDSSGNANTGTANGTLTYSIAGALILDATTAISFNGSSGYFSVADAATVDPADTFTIALWFKKAANGTQMTLMSKGTGAFILYSFTDNKIYLAKTGSTNVAHSSNTITDTNYHFLVVTKNGATTKIYIDGTDVTIADTNQTMTTNATALNIGRDVAGSNHFWSGTMDEVSLFPTALTGGNVSTLYSAATATAAPSPINTNPGDVFIKRLVLGTDAAMPASTSVYVNAPMRMDGNVGWFTKTPIAQQTSGADLTNNVTSGGTSDQIDDFTSLAVYATDAATIRNDIYQLARKLKQVNDALRAYGLLS